jgi:hypothetical protein
MKFKATVDRFEDNALSWEHHLVIPSAVFSTLVQKTIDKRVVCILNGLHQFHCGMLPKTTFHYILLNREVCKKANLDLNDEVDVELLPDHSKYGMPISEEMEEVLSSDPEGSRWFHLLTPGKQRSLIHVVNKYKSSQLKIDKSFVILQHLKNNKGFLDFKELNQDFKDFKNKFSY